MTHSTRRYAPLALLSASLLAACSAPAPTPQLTTASTTTPALTIPITPNDTRSALTQRFNAPILSYAPQAGFAVIGLSHSQARAWRTHPHHTPGSLHPNQGTFHATAGVSLWTDAGVSLWTDAGVSLWTDAGANLWTDGQFSAMPENTQPWQQVALEDGQNLASERGAGIKIAVIDTGVDLDHPALQSHLSDPSDFMDFVDGDRHPDEEGSRANPGYGHGTHVASIIVQFAPKAKIMPLRVLNPDGSGDAANLASAIVFATDRGAHIINLSLGANQHIPAVEKAIEYANTRGSYIVSSAGNRNLEALDYPASHAHQHSARLSLGSVDASDTKSNFGNYASDLKLSAPGEHIWGLAPENAKAAWSGTSTSTAMASGTLALALAEPLSTDRDELGEPLRHSGANLDQVPTNAAYTGKLGTRLDVAAFLRRVRQP